jgi:hypothetical protein
VRGKSDIIILEPGMGNYFNKSIMWNAFSNACGALRAFDQYDIILSGFTWLRKTMNEAIELLNL